MSAIPDIPDHIREEALLVTALGEEAAAIIPGMSLMVRDEGDDLSFEIGVIYYSKIRKSKVELGLMVDRDDFLKRMVRDMAVGLRDHVVNELEGN